MKIFRYLINIFIVIFIISLVFFQTRNKSINYKNVSLGVDLINKREVKNTELNDNTELNEEKDENNEDIVVEEEKKNDVVIEKEIPVIEEKKDSPVSQVQNVVEEKPVVVEEPVSNNNDLVVGALSAYGPDCVGCSGYLASGFNALGGNIYYNDSTYGSVRIVAGDRSYPFGTIINIKGTRLGDVKAIVLDRGGKKI